MKIQLYYSPNTCSLAPFITLTEAGAEFEPMPLNMRKGANKSPEYLALNPKHKVPLLMVDGRPLSENVAIQQWIARTYPYANLLPDDPWQELHAISLLAWCASGIHPYLSRINNAAKVCDVDGTEESVKRLAQEPLFEAFELADGLLKGRDYFFDHFTAPDAHFFWCFRRAGQFGLDLSPFAHCQAHFDRMHTRDSVKKLVAYEAEVKERFGMAA